MPKSYHRRQRSISGNKYTKNTDGNNIYFGKYRFIYLPFTLITKIPFLVFTEIKKRAWRKTQDGRSEWAKNPGLRASTPADERKVPENDEAGGMRTKSLRATTWPEKNALDGSQAGLFPQKARTTTPRESRIREQPCDGTGNFRFSARKKGRKDAAPALITNYAAV